MRRTPFNCVPYLDLTHIADAQHFYKRRGYVEIATPWIVSNEALSATKPPDAKDFSLKCDYYEGDGMNLCASAEQAFIHMMLSGFAFRENTKYQSTGPCFRIEHEYNEFTYPWFFKTELMVYAPTDPETAVMNVLFDAMSFFMQTVGEPYTHHLSFERTPEGIDIHLMGVEIGSYGHRKYKDHNWIYGTGIAEPRFSSLFIK